MFSASVISIIVVVLLLTIYSVYDLRERRVPNRITVTGLIIGVLISIITGHLSANAELRIVSFLFMITVSSVLFKVGALGGADLKTFITISIISPGFELISLNSQFLEGVLISGFELLLTLFGGAMISRFRSSRKPTALIPVLLCMYVIIQLIGIALGVTGTDWQ